jgi:hypothetical protein
MTTDSILYTGLTTLAAVVAILYRKVEAGLKNCENDRSRLLAALIKNQADEDRHTLLAALIKQQADERAVILESQAADRAAYAEWRRQQPRS